MNQRVLLLGIAAILLVGGILVLLNRDEPSPARQLDAASHSGKAESERPGLTARGAEPVTEPEAQPAPTEDEWLRNWDPADGIPMGDDTLRGIVVDPAGRPIFDARLYLRTKEGQPPLLDAPSTWETRSDADGKWQIEMAYASRSLLCVWAPGYERAHITLLDPETELRVVLEPAPTLTVTVKAPVAKRDFLEDGPIEDARIRVRLIHADGREHPRPGEPLLAEWDQLIETGTPTAIRLPRDVRAHLTADAPELASDPPYVALPVPAKSVVLQLVPSAYIELRLLDAATRKQLAIGGGGWGFTQLTHQESGFELESTWSSVDGIETIGHGRGVVPGLYELRARYRGYAVPTPPRTVEVLKGAKAMRVDVPLVRDMQHGTLHLMLQHAAASQHAGQPVQHGLTLIRRREDRPPMWKHAGGMSWMLNDGRMKRTLEDLAVGTYDVLAWDGARFPAVGHLVGREVKGGTEETVDVVLEEGYGFRPTDALGGTKDGSARMRAQSKLLGALPWVRWMGELSLFQTDAQGFTDAPTTGYIGPYPSKQITLVESPKDGKAEEHPLEASISPPR